MRKTEPFPWLSLLRLVAHVADNIFTAYLFYLMYTYWQDNKPDLFLFATIAAGVWCISCSMNQLQTKVKHIHRLPNTNKGDQ